MYIFKANQHKAAGRKTRLDIQNIMDSVLKCCRQCLWWCTGKVDAYIKLELDPADVVECEDEFERDIFLYPDKDLHIQPYMKPQFGYTD